MRNGKPNVILIVCDTLRKDILELYGGPAKTPNLNKLAKDAMVYDNCIAPSPWTFPSHVSLFTGLYPSQHGVHESAKVKLSDCIGLNERLNIERMPEYLTRYGYKTIGISNNLMVSRFTKFDKGFLDFFNIDVDPRNKMTEWKEAEELGGSTLQIAKKLLMKGNIKDLFRYAKAYGHFKSASKAVNYPFDKGATLTNGIIFNANLSPKFFLYINFFEVHEPYKYYSFKDQLDNFTGVKLINKKRVKLLKKQYELESEFLDKNLGRLMEILKERNLYDDTLIIITSDHGQAFNEHGHMFHGTYLYDEIISIPLIIKYPHNKRFMKRKGYQSLVNIFDFIKEIINDGTDAKLTKNIAYSETYGYNRDLPKGYTQRDDYLKLKHQKIRKSIYKNGYKLTLNLTDGIVEEFLKGNRVVNVKDHRKIAESLINNIKYNFKDDWIKGTKVEIL